MELKTKSASKKMKGASDIEYLDEDIDDEGFIEGVVTTGKVLSTFNFGMSEALSNAEVPSNKFELQDSTHQKFTSQNELYPSSPRGLTPPIDGEYFTVKRAYLMRPSTVRKLNVLKAEHPDVNMLFNTIIDTAINHYYNYVFSESTTLHNQEEKKKTS